jgi:hypothetical protein
MTVPMKKSWRLTADQRAKLRAWNDERRTLLNRLREIGSVKDIAAQLGVTPQSIYHHLDPSRRKLRFLRECNS